MAKRKRRTPPDEAFARVVSEELQIYRDALADISPAIQAELNHLLGGRGDWPTHEGAPDIEVLVDILMELYSYAQTDDREQIIDVTRNHLLRIAAAARDDSAPEKKSILHSIAKSFGPIVLEGTVHQQFVSTLAVHVGLLRDDVRPLLRESVVPQLIAALRTVLRAGAPTTRDSAVEGVGALLKWYDEKHKAAEFPPADRLPDTEANPSPLVAERYFERLERRRMMALAVADEKRSRTRFFDRLQDPIASVISRVRKNSSPETRANDVAKALYERSDLLRTLPAILRQHATVDVMRQDAVRFLRDAAKLQPMRETDAESALVAYARFQESVFKTIRVMIKRDADATDFNDVVANAVTAVPYTIVGLPSVCNAQVRSTVAIVRTAVRLIEKDVGPSLTKTALAPLFGSLGETPATWVNVGIAEGCYAALPVLLSNDFHDDLTVPALDALFAHLRQRHDFDDFVETHRQLIANACFRRMLILRMKLATQRQRNGRTATNEQLDETDAEQDVRTLLRWPDTKHVLDIFQEREAEPESIRIQANVAETLISGIAFESDLLRRSAEIFSRWDGFAIVQKVLLTRILAAQLRASSHAREVRRYNLLGRLYAQMPTVSLEEKERLDHVWNLLAALPSGAASAADQDLQDFVDHCGRRNRSTGRGHHHVDDLPGYVLAMISDAPSAGISDAISREIDLNFRHARQMKADFDFAALLYQVTLRGPDENVFNHLLPRLDSRDDRQMVMLFRKHVVTVHETAKYSRSEAVAIEPLLAHVTSFLNDLEPTKSPTLRKLSKALRAYRPLAANDPDAWIAIVGEEMGGGVGELFRLLDDIAESEQAHDVSPGRRKPLEGTYSELLAQLRTGVSDYVNLPVSQFHARAVALGQARNITRDLETDLHGHYGLQPPERIMLIALMRHLQDLFSRTILWYCDEPRRRKESGDHAMFWTLFACDPAEWPSLMKPAIGLAIDAAKALSDGDPEKAEELQMQQPNEELEQLRMSRGPVPPSIPEQRERFERFYIEWVASELRVDLLEMRLKDRWSRPFAWTYGVMTHQWRVVLLLFLPCLAVIFLDRLELHAWEGIIFFLLSATVTIVVPFGLSQRVRPFGHRKTDEQASEPRSKYRLEAILPKLTRLIAAPMAIIVELDHSYHFALKASTWALLLLMLLAYVSTRYFIGREIVHRETGHHLAEPLRTLRRRASQIVAVALYHSFAVAMVFAIIFGSTHGQHMEVHDYPPVRQPAAGSAFFRLIDRFYRHVDSIRPPHEFPFFAGVLPRDTAFDIGEIIKEFHYEISPGLASHLRFSYYPTIVLTWTALGLFLGVFLEGFVKGERLRGPEKNKEH